MKFRKFLNVINSPSRLFVAPWSSLSKKGLEYVVYMTFVRRDIERVDHCILHWHGLTKNRPFDLGLWLSQCHRKSGDGVPISVSDVNFFTITITIFVPIPLILKLVQRNFAISIGIGTHYYFHSTNFYFSGMATKMVMVMVMHWDRILTYFRAQCATK